MALFKHRKIAKLFLGQAILGTHFVNKKVDYKVFCKNH